MSLCENERADEIADRSAARAFVRSGIRRVAVARQREQLAPGGEPGERDHKQRPRRISDGKQLRDVPRCVPAEPVARANVQTRAAGPASPSTRTTARTTSGRACTCGSQSQKWRHGRRKIERVRVRGSDEKTDYGQRKQRGGVAREPLFRIDRAVWRETVTRNEPAGDAQQSEHEQRPNRPAHAVERHGPTAGAAEEAGGGEEEEERIRPKSRP